MEQVSHLGGLDRDVRSELIASLIELLCRTNRAGEAEETLRELPPGLLAPAVFHVVQAYRVASQREHR